MSDGSEPSERRRLRQMLQLEIRRLLDQQPPPGGWFGKVNAALARVASRPVFCRVGDRVLLGYGVFVSLGLALGIFYWLYLIGHRFQRLLPPAVLVLGLVPAAWAGSRVLYLLEREWARRLGQHKIAVKGHAFNGAVLGTLLYLTVVFGRDFGRLLFFLDCAAPAFALIYAFVKLGCLSYGCCVGRPSDSGVAVTYTSPVNKAVGHYRLKGVRLHPLQLYEAAFALGIFLLLSSQAGLHFGTGYPFGVFLVVFSLGRAILVRFRYRLPGERANRWVWDILHAGFVTAGALLIGRARLRPLSPVISPPVASEPASFVVLLGVSVAVGALGLWLFAVYRHDAV